MWDSWGRRRGAGVQHGLAGRDRGCTRQSPTMNGSTLVGADHPPPGRRPAAPTTTDRRRQTRLQDKLRDQQRASRWHNKHSTTATVQTNLEHFWRGSEAHRSTLVPTIPQIRAAALSSGLDTHPNKADSVRFTAVAETIYEARTQEEAMVQDLLEQWRKGGHGYVPDVKGDSIVRLGCENANSLSLFDPRSTKLRKLLSLHNKYQMVGACIVEHGTNFLMVPVGQQPENIYATFRGSRVSAAHNIHNKIVAINRAGH